MEILYEADNIIISCDPKGILGCKWVGFQTTQGIQDAGAIILTSLKEKGVTRVLNDNREVEGPWQEAAKWTQKHWFPAMHEAGLKHFAWILSVNIFAELSARLAMANNEEVVKAFYNYHQACGWLLKQKK